MSINNKKFIRKKIENKKKKERKRTSELSLEELSLKIMVTTFFFFFESQAKETTVKWLEGKPGAESSLDKIKK